MEIKLEEQNQKLIISDEFMENGFVNIRIEDGEDVRNIDIHSTDLYQAVKPFMEKYCNSLKRDKLLKL